MIMSNLCMLNSPWDVNETLGVWRKRVWVQRMMSRSRLGKAGVCGSNVQFPEAEPARSSIKGRIEPAWGDTLGRGGRLLGGADSLWSVKETWWRNWMGKDVRGNCVCE